MVCKSAGIICYRYNNDLKRYEVIMIRHRYTYAFATFVKGIYSPNNNNQIIGLLNQMTPQEKIDIMTLNFDLLWFRLWCKWPKTQTVEMTDWTDIYKKRQMIDVVKGHSEQQHTYFLKKKKRFENVFCRDDGKRLRGMLNKTTKCGHLMWELPKGRAGVFESIVDSASREFEEETNIPISKCTLLPIRPIVETFADLDITYKYIFYFARYNHRFVSPQIKLISPDQSLEVDDIKWVGSADINNLCENNRIKKRMCRIFRIIRRIKI